MNKILQFVPPNISVIDQGAIVANSLADYLQRHPEMEERCSKNAQIRFYTTGDPADFDEHGSRFFGNPVQSNACSLL
jgi:glutamate racemase